MLRRVVEKQGQSAFADAHGINRSYVSNVLAGRALPGPAILDALGLERVVTYRGKK
jgi:hypothetical protein